MRTLKMQGRLAVVAVLGASLLWAGCARVEEPSATDMKRSPATEGSAGVPAEAYIGRSFPSPELVAESASALGTAFDVDAPKFSPHLVEVPGGLVGGVPDLPGLRLDYRPEPDELSLFDTTITPPGADAADIGEEGARARAATLEAESAADVASHHTDASIEALGPRLQYPLSYERVPARLTVDYRVSDNVNVGGTVGVIHGRKSVIRYPANRDLGGPSTVPAPTPDAGGDPRPTRP